jgi:hypothetical protein
MNARAKTQKGAYMKNVLLKFTILVWMCAFANAARADLGTAIINGLFNDKTVADNMVLEKKARAEKARALDPALFDHFSSTSDDGTEALPQELIKAGYIPYLVQENRVLVIHDVLKGNSVRDVFQHVDSYVSAVGKDVISLRYINFAKSRGNLVRLYQPSIGDKIQIATKWKYKEAMGWEDLDRCLVEFNKEGEVVSMLSRFHSFDTAEVIGVAKRTITEIVFGQPTTTRFQDSLKAEELQDAFIREMK